MTRVLDCTTTERRSAAVAAAVSAVRDGRLVVLPTDTVYGVGADAFDARAVAAILAAKGRGRDMPPPVLVPDERTVDGLATRVPRYARILMERYWPGPLTIVLPAQSSLLWDLGESNGTVALRMPDNDIALEVLRAVGPMAVTSANRTGHPPATTVAQAVDQLGDAVEVYLDGGPSRSGAASTMLDCTGASPVLLRAGPVNQLAVDAALSAAAAQDQALALSAREAAADASAPPAPGPIPAPGARRTGIRHPASGIRPRPGRVAGRARPGRPGTSANGSGRASDA